MPEKFKNIPTNIISGFLGAGKTTAIQYLLKNKPAAEKWAVIVNEFGQIGIDGALLKNDSVEIKQIPGGCLCCVGSQSLSVGLNQLIRSVKPQRIIIEPTGLGHPAKLVATLTGEFYKNVLDLRAIINLVDARNLSIDKYITHESFIDQSNLADLLVASKLDSYSEYDKNLFYQYAATFIPEKIKVAMIEQGRLQLSWLNLPHDVNRGIQFPDSHKHYSRSDKPVSQDDKSDNGWLMIEAYANGYTSLGWKLSEHFVFDREKLLSFIESEFSHSSIERIKGVLMTNEGPRSINATPREALEFKDCPFQAGSIFELISIGDINSEQLDQALKSCLNS